MRRLTKPYFVFSASGVPQSPRHKRGGDFGRNWDGHAIVSRVCPSDVGYLCENSEPLTTVL
jgi:hypothetical protein